MPLSEQEKELKKRYDAQRYLEKKAEIKAQAKDYRDSNKEKIAAASKAYRAEHKERIDVVAKAWRVANRDSNIKRSAAWNKNNPAKTLESRRVWIAANRDKARNSYRKYYRANKASRMALGAKWRGAKLSATPLWADDFVLQEIYELAAIRSKATGIKWHVDHIVPLRSKLVCGLHCEANLQLITAKENLTKSNRVWPNMP